MPAIELHNTLGGRTEPLTPERDNTLRMYCCGPTVYDYGHIGNFRTFLHVDVLRRYARLRGMNLLHVMNITDVEDKIIRNANAAGMPIDQYTAKFERAFLEDMDALGVERPEILARATENIPEMVSLIERLASEDIAYKTDDGSWYFRIDRFPDYGKLSGKDLEGIEDGARVDVDEYAKDSARDFALWKACKPGEASWDTAIGCGRPGWHIECSAMAMKHLGPTFDLHAGGEDLMFPHHENEIAQSECASHQPFARHWFHVRFLLVEGKKMSKSEGNFYTLRDLLLMGHRASSIRFLLLSVPYRHQMNFTFDGLTESANAIDRLRTFAKRLHSASQSNPAVSAAEAATGSSTRSGNHAASAAQVATSAVQQPAALAAEVATGPAQDRGFSRRGDKPSAAATEFGTPNSELATLLAQKREAYHAALSNDLNTAEARAAIFDVVRAVNIALDNGTVSATDLEATRALLNDFDAVFDVLTDRDAATTQAAIDWAKAEGREASIAPELLNTLSLSDADIDQLIAERNDARKRRNFARADAIRNELLEKGILLEDTKAGVTWKRK
ncbi:cysteine--tRNA ligase [Terriglobus aquaticus]|uniref:Cysteine--tRNA ligase n=1 Tax=Terriglobus aquaticus TaxID=940139 RepID=A0ABW9KG81_9BACT|nr:cysteine--tRNA ligase [Terriglobus aquaticus]